MGKATIWLHCSYSNNFILSVFAPLDLIVRLSSSTERMVTDMKWTFLTLESDTRVSYSFSSMKLNLVEERCSKLKLFPSTWLFSFAKQKCVVRKDIWHVIYQRCKEIFAVIIYQYVEFLIIFNVVETQVSNSNWLNVTVKSLIVSEPYY